MKLVTYEIKKAKKGGTRVGIFLEGDYILDLQAASALYLREEEQEKKPYDLAGELFAGDIKRVLEKGKMAINLAQKTYKNFL